MPPRHSRDEQAREPVAGAAAAETEPDARRARWPLNKAVERRDPPSKLRSRPEAGVAVAAPPSHASPSPAPKDGQGAAATSDGRTGAAAGDVLDRPPADDFATYVREQLRREGRGDPSAVGHGTVYRTGEVTTHDGVEENILGLNYSTVAPRAPVGDDTWARSLRSFAQGAVWLLPAGVVLMALSSVFGTPSETSEPALVSPGTWVVLTTLGLGLWLLGVTALAALVATTRARSWAIIAVVSSTLGVAMVAPLVGVAGLARPAITRTARAVEDDPNIATAAARMQHGILDHAAGRWLIIAGGLLLAVGAVAVVFTILGSRVLQRHDGWLMLIGVVLAIAAAALAWDFLFTLAAMVMLAAVLGLAYTASRIAPDGTPPPAY